MNNETEQFGDTFNRTGDWILLKGMKILFREAKKNGYSKKLSKRWNELAGRIQHWKRDLAKFSNEREEWKNETT